MKPVSVPQITTFTFARFGSVPSKFFALAQMYFSHRHLRAVPGLLFYRLMASGRGFSPKPDFSTFCLLQTWQSGDHADLFFAGNPWWNKYRTASETILCISGTCTRAHGSWDGQAPFEVQLSEEAEAKILVLTRATVQLSRLRRFWKFVPKSHPDLSSVEGLIFSKGVGEKPFTRMATISVWESEKAIHAFAYQYEGHKEAMRRRSAEKWYAEEMFCRFKVRDIRGRFD